MTAAKEARAGSWLVFKGDFWVFALTPDHTQSIISFPQVLGKSADEKRDFSDLIRGGTRRSQSKTFALCVRWLSDRFGVPSSELGILVMAKIHP